VSRRYDELAAQARAALEGAGDGATLEQVRIDWLGRRGRITLELRAIPGLPLEERPEAGRRLNTIKNELQELLEERRSLLTATAPPEGEGTDLTHPGRVPFIGRLHPLTRIRRRIEEVFRELGFDVAEGPEVETEYYNFEALNIPEHHPARGMWDTFFTRVPPGLLLRTHTSPVQVRVMESRPAPVRIIVPGRCYRSDAPDATHSPVFHQIEGLYVDTGVSLTDLRGVLDAFVHRLFGAGAATRFRPSYFPFTEPSAELDMGCMSCGGKGCRICKGTGWIEILGAGMVNPVLYGFVGYDAERLSGYAFGLGIERLAMRLHGIDDIRLFYENDLRFLEQC
jgi:phenylalanyl-tRNA synthetase alpha chain